MHSGKKLKVPNPINGASFLSRLFFIWIIKMYRRILKKDLKVSDLYKVPDSDKSEKLGDLLEENWMKEKSRAKLKKQKPKLLRAISATFFRQYMVYGGALFVQNVVLRSFQPIVLGYLISVFATTSTNQTGMYISDAILIGTTFLIMVITHHTNFGQAAIGMRIRAAVSSLIYRKIMKLNKQSINETSVDKILNLLTKDAKSFDSVVLSLHYLWILPFQVPVITFLCWKQTGTSGLIGVGSIALLALPVQIGKSTSLLKKKLAKKRDARVSLMSNIISRIQVIKMYAWEELFEKDVQLARHKEVIALSIKSHLSGIYVSLKSIMERIAVFLTSLSYTLSEHMFQAEQLYSIVRFFSVLKLTMADYLPRSIRHGTESNEAIKRIEDFLLMEEAEEPNIDSSVGVSLKNVYASWNNFFLEDISFRVPRGFLCAIVGPVGAGKTSIIHLLLNELKPKSGTITIQGSVSYASEEPWLFASTIRNNILCGEKYHKKLYNKVVKVCDLQKDIDHFLLGDKTLVGEQGATISDAQRARINLARAVYRDTDVYLLDDPFASMDTSVGRNIFEECIVKYLHGRTRILVTHEVQFLKRADLIIVIKNGRIEAEGSYEKLCQRLQFTDFGRGEEITENEDTREPLIFSKSLLMESSYMKCEHSQPEEEDSRKRSKSLMWYIRASGCTCLIILVLLAFVLCEVLSDGADYWAFSLAQEETPERNKTIAHGYFRSNASSPDPSKIPPTSSTIRPWHVVVPGVVPPIHQFLNQRDSNNLTPLNKTQNDQMFRDTYAALYKYLGIIVALTTVTFVRSLWYFIIATRASKHLHNNMFKNFLEAHMKFFNTNPARQVLDRFSTDMTAIDEILPKVLLETTSDVLKLGGILVMMVISNYYMVAVIFVLGLVFMKIRTWLVSTTEFIKRLEERKKLRVFSHLTNSLDGIATIRVFRAEGVLKKAFDQYQDIHTSVWFLLITATSSFGLWLDLVCLTFTTCTSFSFILLNQYGKTSSALVGMGITYSLSLIGMLQVVLLRIAAIIKQLSAVKRVIQHTEIKKEILPVTPPANRLSSSWPQHGSITIKNLYSQYSPGSSPVLKNLNVEIQAGEKVGIVGRTGAGKTSLILALFRFTDISGCVFIDGVDTKRIVVRDFRRKISLIPEEPLLFAATLRKNLDPFGEFGDDKIWTALEEVGLKDVVQDLELPVAKNGENFSVSQRQLLSLAQVVLKNNKILVVEEATAYDDKTYSLIQKVIGTKFQDCTILTVTHNLYHVMDSDKIMVMDNGQILEFDSPFLLLQNPQTIFSGMVSERGLETSRRLNEMALDAFLNRRTPNLLKKIKQTLRL